MKRKKNGFVTIVFLLLLVIPGLIFTYFFLASPHQVHGSPIEPFKQGQFVLSEKISYLFKKPEIGDRVIFKSGELDIDYIGIITGIQKEGDVPIYVVLSSVGQPWKLTVDEIKSRIYYPSLTKKEELEEEIPSRAVEIATPTQSVVSPIVAPKITATPSLKPTPTIPPLKTVTVNGFAYEDRSDDGLFNSDDPKLPYMQFYLYDSYESSKQISTVFTDQAGNFSISLKVRGNLIIKPTTYNNFRPRGGSAQFSTSTSGIQFGFRSATAPVVGQSGIIEGDIFQDSNRNGVRDAGEQGIYFYKLYLVDNDGYYYQNTSQNAQATDAGGHFKYLELPFGKTYTLRLSNPTGDYTIYQSEKTMTLTSTHPEEKDINIPVFKNSQ